MADDAGTRDGKEEGAQGLPQWEFEGKKLVVRLNTTIEGKKDAIPPLVQGVMQLVRMIGCAAGRETQVEIALTEALANAVVHGCKNDPSKKVECWVACDEDQEMLIVIRDPGEGFDPSSIPSPIVAQNLLAPHGRGIFLINQLVDEVRYEKGGTEIRMRIR